MEGFFMFRLHHTPVSVHCDPCGWHATFDTRSAAFAAMDDHELHTTHFDLFWKHTNGWRRFNPPAWLYGSRYVADSGMRV